MRYEKVQQAKKSYFLVFLTVFFHYKRLMREKQNKLVFLKARFAKLPSKTFVNSIPCRE